MKFSLALYISACLFVSTAFAVQTSSGVVSVSGAIASFMSSKATRIGVQVTATTSGSVGTPTATLQGSMDNVNWFTVPIEATGDATKSAVVPLNSGAIFLTDYNVNYEWFRVFFSSIVGGGSLIVTQIEKMFLPKQ